MRFSVQALCAARACAASAIYALDGAQHEVRRSGSAGTASSGRRSSAATGRSSPTTGWRRCWRSGSCERWPKPASRSSPSGSSPRATAASSRCSTARTSCSRSPARSRSPTSRRRPARPCDGPYDLSLVEGSITTAHDAERIHEIRARLEARSSRSAPAPPPGASRRCATSPTSRTSSRSSTPRPEFISTLATSTPIAAHVPVDFELHGLPDRQAPAAGGDLRLPARPPRRTSRRRASASSASAAAPSASWSPTARRAWARSRTPAAARSAPPTTAAATAASGRWRRRTPPR